jgi:hypothetical protein
MPCSDGVPPSCGESHDTAKLIQYVAEQMGFELPVWIIDAARSAYGDHMRNGDLTEILCGTIRGMTPEQENRIVYNGRDPMSRRLADWWERHEEIDRQRLVAEAARVERGRAILYGLSETDRDAVLAFLQYQTVKLK